jgi:hypothetical protein
MVDHERDARAAAALAASTGRADPPTPDPLQRVAAEDARRSRLCSLPAHGLGACSRHRPFMTATFGQPGAPQTLSARRTSTSSAAGRAVRRTRQLRSPGRGRPPRPAPRRRRPRQSDTPASRAHRPCADDRTRCTLALPHVSSRQASSSTTRTGAWSASSSRTRTTWSVLPSLIGIRSPPLVDGRPVRRGLGGCPVEPLELEGEGHPALLIRDRTATRSIALTLLRRRRLRVLPAVAKSRSGTGPAPSRTERPKRRYCMAQPCGFGVAATGGMPPAGFEPALQP